MPGREYPQGPEPIHKHGLPVEDKSKLTTLPLKPQRLSAFGLGCIGPLKLPTLYLHNDVYFRQFMQLDLPDRLPNKEQTRNLPGRAFQQSQYTTLSMQIQDHCHQCQPQP